MANRTNRVLPRIKLPENEQSNNSARNQSSTFCPSCGNRCSKLVDRCLKCGHPVHRGFLGWAGTERLLDIVVLIVILVGVFVVGGAVSLLGLLAVLVTVGLLSRLFR